ncbi:DUF4317 domain-containing protein [Clostridium thermopalmarium]|uniref:DUF4317 domain-containing protein n=1 Tax=Clostridium thermopalmarium DSM 5974 TaxID=1121340 RepID=A0A2T0AY99_9CLOT|nr:DUF4317 domain-containing protein [Clostridium thermopalmarium]PRR75884.1 hypothetical protein CPAL_03750 [Clostridium thermopalmarium DSM 5974]PVZ24462.1 uncharacterized protein DUF4317 [Clostridium thermopalmarium DSM 5974]
MRKKDILELKRRLKKDHCTFSKMCGCYVNGEKHIILKFRETFLNLEEEEYFKYLEIAKKVLSGTIGNNILELNFPLNEDLTNEKQVSLMQLRNSKLKDDAILDAFYDLIIDNYDYTGNFIILLFHDAYDVITKTKDNLKIDESEEVYEYILCAICPVSLSEPGLGYFEEENKIKARIRDWVVEAPTNGFVFPAFIDRSADINSIMYYTKNAKNTHPELMQNVLGCYPKQTATIQKETFQSIIKDSFSADEEKADKIFMKVQENLNTMVEEYTATYEDTYCEPITLTKDHIQNLLIESGVPEEITAKIENSYVENFGDDLPLAENLIDSKALKANEQLKKEENLQKQIEILETKLQQVKQENDEVSSEYDIVLKVKPEKIPQIKSEIIDGKKCIIIPIDENEQATVNGLDDIV